MNLEPTGGNLYRPHKFMVSSGEFWRCKHGTTGFGKGMIWKGCLRCMVKDLRAYIKWHTGAYEKERTNEQG